MRLLTISSSHGLTLGVKTDKGIIDVALAKNHLGEEHGIPVTMDELVRGGEAAKSNLDHFISNAIQEENKAGPWFHEESSITIGPSVPSPGKIICVGLNYRRHADETGMAIPEFPILFSKFNNAITGHLQEISLPEDGNQFDYEAELAIVIGKKAENVSREAALSHVFGYTNANDFSCRDLQFRSGQWLLGKSYDTWCPVGPYILTADEIEDPNNLGIRCIVNGDIRQNSNTADMIFACDELISYISKYITLEPGDLILTGTPEGVAMGMESKPWVKPGDEIVVEVEGLGTLSNRVGERKTSTI
ncbi:fumarylacetoacetate hydrolase family protein [Bacillus sp. V5-8f]|uniref:fumarylacetoacetate hydrolase family protein n=1 Tax=Bacillus sp. V5-8f TaxID=2053044 RepID=UPI000C760D06|nr:fumarylacetoacetate hydrolase family protein [Bacillus sp. V5-8f]PLT33112.1 FAA hydrolase family protein [Bacillus sp. V5-8f]